MNINSKKNQMGNLLNIEDMLTSVVKNLEILKTNNIDFVIADMEGEIGYNSNYNRVNLLKPYSNNASNIKIENDIIKFNPAIYTFLIVFANYNIDIIGGPLTSQNIIYDKVSYYINNNYDEPKEYPRSTLNSLLPYNVTNGINVNRIFILTPESPICGYSLENTTNVTTANRVVRSSRLSRLVIIGVPNNLR